MDDLLAIKFENLVREWEIYMSDEDVTELMDSFVFWYNTKY